jgi:hypothetical protein
VSPTLGDVVNANQHIEHTRAAFADFLREQAEWRRARADEWPEDPRNRRSSEALNELASWVMTLPNDDERLQHIADCFPEEPPFLPVGDDVARFAARYGFSFPADPDRFLNSFVALTDEIEARRHEGH